MEDKNVFIENFTEKLFFSRKWGKQWKNAFFEIFVEICKINGANSLVEVRLVQKKSEICKVTRFHCRLTQKYRVYMPQCSIHFFFLFDWNLHSTTSTPSNIEDSFHFKTIDSIKYLLENDGITKYQEWWRYSSVENDGIFSTSMNHRNTSNSNKEKQSIDPFTVSRRYHMVKIHVIKVVGFYFGNGLLMIQSPVYTCKKHNYTYA